MPAANTGWSNSRFPAQSEATAAASEEPEMTGGEEDGGLFSGFFDGDDEGF